MPSINDSRKVITTTIKGIEGSTIELWDEITGGDSEAIAQQETDAAKGLYTMFVLIKSWNLDEDLTFENVKKLTADQIGDLLSKTTLYLNAIISQEQKEDEALEKKTD